MRTLRPTAALLPNFVRNNFLRNNGGSIGKDFCNSVHHFVRVVSDRNDRICAVLGSVDEHDVERLLPCLLAQFGEEGDIPTNKRLECPAYRAEDRTGSDSDAAHHTKTAYNAVAGQFKRSRNHKRQYSVELCLHHGPVYALEDQLSTAHAWSPCV